MGEPSHFISRTAHHQEGVSLHNESHKRHGQQQGHTRNTQRLTDTKRTGRRRDEHDLRRACDVPCPPRPPSPPRG